MAIDVCLQFFCDIHKETLGHPYMISYGKDNAILKQLLSTYGVKKLTKLISIFFQEIKKDKFLQGTGASVGILKSQIPKLLLKLSNDTEKVGKW